MQCDHKLTTGIAFSWRRFLILTREVFRFFSTNNGSCPDPDALLCISGVIRVAFHSNWF